MMPRSLVWQWFLGSGLAGDGLSVDHAHWLAAIGWRLAAHPPTALRYRPAAIGHWRVGAME
jgi:hypothetical protein